MCYPDERGLESRLCTVDREEGSSDALRVSLGNSNPHIEQKWVAGAAIVPQCGHLFASAVTEDSWTGGDVREWRARRDRIHMW